MVDEDKKGTLLDFDSFKEKISIITSEIDQLKNSFTKGAEELSRIQSLLDVSKIENISGIIDSYESKIVEEEKRRVEAEEQTKRFSQELEKEKERLLKLWDAYKKQEEEIVKLENKIKEYEEKIRNVEASKNQLEIDYTARIKTLEQRLKENEEKILQFDDYKKRCEEFEVTFTKLKDEIKNLQEECKRKDNTIAELNKQLENLKQSEDYLEYKTKYENLIADYEKERERLAKLYHLYEEIEKECKRLKEENESWQNWYNSNKEIFSKAFLSPPITRTDVSESTVTEAMQEEKPDRPQDTAQKKKRWFFRK